MIPQMVESGSVLVVRNREGVMNAPMVLGNRIDRWVALHQNETGASRIEEHHSPVRSGRQMPAADHVRIEPRASLDVTHGNAEMGNGLHRHHLLISLIVGLYNRSRGIACPLGSS